MNCVLFKTLVLGILFLYLLGEVLSWNPILTKDSCGFGGSSYRRTGNRELPPPSFFPPDSLLLRILVFKNEWLPLSDPYCPTWEWIANAFRFLNRVLWSVRAPGCQRRPWGDLVVPTWCRQWGRSMDSFSFCHISLKGLKGDSASSCLQGPTWSSSPGWSQMKKP